MGRKLIVYLIDGTDNGPKSIEIGNWSGKAIHSPVSHLPKLINRPEFEKPGIYILKSDPIENIYSEKIYIGEAEKIGVRLKQHLRNPDRDFKECIFFISKDEMLTKSHIKYIESRLVSLAEKAKNSEIENGNTPTESSLSEADISDMEYYIDQIKLILPTAGYFFLLSNIKTNTLNDFNELDSDQNEIIFKIKSKELNSFMLPTDNGYVVKKGSEANITTSASFSESWKKLREKLTKNNIIKEINGKLVFQEDTVFNSISAASSIILGRQSAGTIEWITENGKNYKEYQSEVIGSDDET